jgi:hypothetical protein
VSLRASLLTIAFIAMSGPVRAADAQLKPFIGLGFAGNTTFLADLDHAAANRHAMFGLDAVWLRDLVGIDVDVAHAPGFFTGKEGTVPPPLVLHSSVTTVTGNVVITLPRRWTEYFLRPYVLAGGGFAHLRSQDYFKVFTLSETLTTVDFGVGVTGMLTNRTGLSWELRRFDSFGGKNSSKAGETLGRKRVSFWRASMAFVYRY